MRLPPLQALSPVGRCKSFDASGDGYGRGEAFTIALLRCAGPKFQCCSATCMAILPLHQREQERKAPETLLSKRGSLSPGSEFALKSTDCTQRAAACPQELDSASMSNVKQIVSPCRRAAESDHEAWGSGVVIAGGAINQDGRSSSLTAPNGPSQQALLRLAAVGVPILQLHHCKGDEVGAYG